MHGGDFLGIKDAYQKFPLFKEVVVMPRQVQAPQLERMLGILLRAASHDIRTPLTGIGGATNVLLEQENTLREKNRADTEKNRADAEKNRAEEEKRRADTAVEEIEKLRRQLEELQKQ